MVRFFLILFVLFLSKFSFAQTNLILNPSFETFTSCPSSQAELNKAAGWDSCRYTPDYFNTCSSSSEASVPSSDFGNQVPLNGNAYAGFCTFDASFQNYREYIIGTLSASLTIGQKYFVSLMVNRADANLLMGYSTNMIGVNFSKAKLSSVPLTNSSKISNSNIISDTINWVKVFGSFISDSAYKYILIGNFFDDSNCAKTNHGTGPLAYYFLDQVCLSQDSIYAQNYAITFNKEVLNDNTNFNAYYDSDKNIIKLKKNKMPERIIISDTFGRLIINEISEKEDLVFSCASFNTGIYIITVENRVKKILITP